MYLDDFQTALDDLDIFCWITSLILAENIDTKIYIDGHLAKVGDIPIAIQSELLKSLLPIVFSSYCGFELSRSQDTLMAKDQYSPNTAQLTVTHGAYCNLGTSIAHITLRL